MASSILGATVLFPGDSEFLPGTGEPLRRNRTCRGETREWLGPTRAGLGWCRCCSSLALAECAAHGWTVSIRSRAYLLRLTSRHKCALGAVASTFGHCGRQTSPPPVPRS